MLIASNWHSNYSIRFSPITIVQIIFSAGTVFVLSALQAISGPRLGRVTLTTSLNQIQQCIDYLAIIGESWDCSYRVREILLNIVDAQLKPRLLLRSGGAALPPAPPPLQPLQPLLPSSHPHPHPHSHTLANGIHVSSNAPASPSGSMSSQNASPQMDAGTLPHRSHPHHPHHAHSHSHSQHSMMSGGSPVQTYSDPSYSPQWQSIHGSPHSLAGASGSLMGGTTNGGGTPSSPTGPSYATSAIDYGMPTSPASSYGGIDPTSPAPGGAGPASAGSDMDITMNYPGMVLEFAMAPYDTSLPTQSAAYMPFGTPWDANVYQQNVLAAAAAAAAAGAGGPGGTPPPPPGGFSDEELAIMDQIVRQQQSASSHSHSAHAGHGQGIHHHQLDHGVSVPLHSRR